MELSQVMRTINRFKREEHWTFAAMAVEATYRTSGPKAALLHAKRIAAAYKGLRAHSVQARTEALRAQARRQGLRYV
jgi:hypothetical protein